jgi:stress-induced morphogen
MSRTLAAIVACGFLLAPTITSAADQSDKAAVTQASATCRSEVRERVKYNEMSLWAQHKAVKKCVKEALAKH